MKLSPKKNGSGYITSYTINIGSAEARNAGFIDVDGNSLELEKIIDTYNNTITIQLKKQED